MKTLITVLLASIVSFGFSQKIATGTYETEKDYNEVYLTVLKTIPLSKFSVKSTDKELGTITASQLGKGTAAEYASLFIIVKKENDKVTINATFTRNPGFTGREKPETWAQEFGDKLKEDLADLTISIVTKK